MPIDIPEITKPVETFNQLHLLNISIVTDINGPTNAVLTFTAIGGEDGNKVRLDKTVTEYVNVTEEIANGNQTMLAAFNAILAAVGEMVPQRHVVEKLAGTYQPDPQPQQLKK